MNTVFVVGTIVSFVVFWIGFSMGIWVTCRHQRRIEIAKNHKNS